MVLLASRSYDAFERLQRRAKGKSAAQVLGEWRNYWTDKIDGKMRIF